MLVHMHAHIHVHIRLCIFLFLLSKAHKKLKELRDCVCTQSHSFYQFLWRQNDHTFHLYILLIVLRHQSDIYWLSLMFSVLVFILHKKIVSFLYLVI